MLILLDQGVPAPLRHFLKKHEVRTATEQGWGTLSNGDLLKEAETAGFDLLITADKNLAYQQNLKERSIAILVLSTPQWPIVKLNTQRVVAAVDSVTAGIYITVDITSD